MRVIEAHLDRETAERVGAGGTFQVFDLTDEKGNNVTNLIDQGQHFWSIEELQKALSGALGEDVTVVEV